MKKFSHLTQGNNWIITKDFVDDDKVDAKGCEIDELVNTLGFTEAFRMYDDDGNLYYQGLAKPNANFDPLDDFGMPNAGCTDIAYRNKINGKYESL